MVQRVFNAMPTQDAPTIVRYTFLLLCIEALMQPIFKHKNHECGKWRRSLARAEAQLHFEEVRGTVIEETIDRTKREFSKTHPPETFRHLHIQHLKEQQRQEHHRTNIRHLTQKVEHIKLSKPYICKRREYR